MSNLSNLPPGVTESMIPGNRPEDEAHDKFIEHIFTMLGESIGEQRAKHFFDYIDKEDWEEVLLELVDIAAGLGAAKAVMEAQYEADIERLLKERGDETSNS